MFKRFNEWLASKGTAAFNTMWMFYAFAIYGALGAVFPTKQGPLLYWSNWIQLVSLPLLGVGVWLTGRTAEKRAQETHDAVMEELLLARAERVEIAQLLAAVTKEPSPTPAGPAVASFRT